MPRVSVVIPAYNNADFIDDAMRSILSQTYRDFELIVADHSSTDDTVKRLARYADDPRVLLLSTPRGGGASRNWNRVTDAAGGELLKLVPGDDVLYPTMLAAHVAALDAHPHAVLAASKRDILDASGRTTMRARGLQGLRPGAVAGVAAIRRTVRAGTNVFGEPHSVTMRREHLVAAGGWDARFPYLIDQTSYSRVLLRGALVAVAGVHSAFRVNAGQWSIALVDEQARQVKDYHAWCRAQAPEAISQGDVWYGNRRAEVTARARRAYYRLMGARLRRGAEPQARGRGRADSGM